MGPVLTRFQCLPRRLFSLCIRAAQPENPRERSTARAVILLMSQAHQNIFRTSIRKMFTGVWPISDGSQGIHILSMAHWHYAHRVLFTKASLHIRTRADPGGLPRT